MFDSVDSIEWARLSHAYGTAEETPSQLAALGGSSKDDRDEALEWCWEFLIHQGSRYEATAYAVPFLFEILDRAKAPFDRQLIDLTLALGVGLGKFFLPRGYDLAEEQRRFEEGSPDGPFASEDERAAYWAVHERATWYVKFLRPERKRRTRIAASFAVANFAQDLSRCRAEIAGYVESESDEALSASLILCLGMLGRYADPKPDVHLLAGHLAPDRSPALRVAAAIAMTTTLGEETPEPAVRTLLDAVGESREFPPEIAELPWNEGDLLGYAALALRLAGANRRDEIARTLCKALAGGRPGTFAISQTLLETLFPDPTPATGRKVSDLDAVQRESLAVLFRSGQWRTWMVEPRVLPPGTPIEESSVPLAEFVREILGDEAIADADSLAWFGNVSPWDLKNGET